MGGSETGNYICGLFRGMRMCVDVHVCKIGNTSSRPVLCMGMVILTALSLSLVSASG